MRELDDAMMIKIMAAENDTIYNCSPEVITETVRAARDFLGLPGETQSPEARVALQKNPKRAITALQIAEFLGWIHGRVSHALQVIESDDAELLEILACSA